VVPASIPRRPTCYRRSERPPGIRGFPFIDYG
jgi:hypothetical protein